MVIIPEIDENYSSYINRILSSRENIRDKNEYQEKHHIVPRCCGGMDEEDNLIYLYAEEHYYSHKLLALENPDNEKLQYAWWNLCHCIDDNRIYDVDPDEYAEARKRFSKLMSEANSGENSFWYGKNQSKESNKKRSESLSGKNNPMFGHRHSEEVKQYISSINKGRLVGDKHPRAKKVLCINNGMIFDTATAAAKFFGLKSRSSITLCCKGDTKSAGIDPNTGEKLLWKYYEE